MNVEFVDMLNMMRYGNMTLAASARFYALSRPVTYNDGIEPTELYVYLSRIKARLPMVTYDCFADAGTRHEMRCTLRTQVDWHRLTRLSIHTTPKIGPE